jgi:hypothetical protein
MKATLHSSLQVGDGEFAVAVDVTGWQTFPDDGPWSVRREGLRPMP